MTGQSETVHAYSIQIISNLSYEDGRTFTERVRLFGLVWFFLGGGGHTHSMRMFPSNPHPSCPWCHSSNHAQLPRLLLLSHREPRPPRVFTGARSHTAGPRERDQVTSVANPGPGTSEPRAAPVGKRPLTSSAFQKMPPKLVYFQMPLKGASLNFTKVLKKTALLT